MAGRAVIAACLCALLFSACASQNAPSTAHYYLVRHAEKTADKPDPALTEAGQARAMALAAKLTHVQLTHIYSTDYKRTRGTAAPTAKDQNLDVQIYDPRNLQDFANALLQQDGHILVVGHSNTTPELSALLGGMKGEPIDDASEFDRFYHILRQDEQITSRIDRYGD